MLAGHLRFCRAGEFEGSMLELKEPISGKRNKFERNQNDVFEFSLERWPRQEAMASATSDGEGERGRELGGLGNKRRPRQQATASATSDGLGNKRLVDCLLSLLWLPALGNRTWEILKKFASVTMRPRWVQTGSSNR